MSVSAGVSISASISVSTSVCEAFILRLEKRLALFPATPKTNQKFQWHEDVESLAKTVNVNKLLFGPLLVIILQASTVNL